MVQLFDFLIFLRQVGRFLNKHEENQSACDEQLLTSDRRRLFPSFELPFVAFDSIVQFDILPLQRTFLFVVQRTILISEKEKIHGGR